MVSTFGPQTRGVSPYADALTKSIKGLGDIELDRMDYIKPFPTFILPQDTDYNALNEHAKIDYLNPFTWNVLKYKRYDIVHIQYWSPAFLPVILAIIARTKSSKSKFIVTWHNPTPHERFPFLRHFEKKLASHCDGIICHTAAGQTLLATIYPDNNITVIHHGCELVGINRPQPDDFKRCQVSSKFSYILFFGNIRPYKGVDLLLDVWERVNACYPRTKLIVAGRLWDSGRSVAAKLVNKLLGTTNYSKIIRNRLDTMTDSTISDIGFISEERLYSYIKVSKFAVFPYHSFESQSGAAATAVGCGLPIITTGVGGLKELAISDKFISGDWSVESLEKVLLDALANRDENLRHKQFEVAKQYSWHNSAEKHIEAYNNL